MFVTVMCDMGSDESRKAMHDLLGQYGFSKIMRACYESAEISDDQLVRLKRDIDSATDYYDTVMIHQYPIDDTLVITRLKEKKWRKTIVRKPVEKEEADVRRPPAANRKPPR
jgi:CRISPR/Cas system-associated endoribonuclease Cas2